MKNKLIIEETTFEERQKIKKFLTLPNPMFWKMKKMGKYVGYLSPEIKYYEEADGILRIPRGAISFLKENFQFSCSDQRVCPTLPPIQSSIVLRQNQIGVAEEAVKRQQGILKMYTSYGKTIIALKIAELINTNILIVVPRKTIQEQFESSRKELFGGNDEYSQRVKVTTSQALISCKKRRRELFDEVSRSFGAVLVDECHKCVSAKTRDVIESFAAKYRFGLSATPDRSDGQGKAIEFIFGPVIVEKASDQAPPEVVLKPFYGHIPMGEYGDIIKFQSELPERNDHVISCIKEAIKENRKVIVLCKRIKNVEEIHRRLSADHMGYALTGNSGQDVLHSLRSDDIKFDFVVGTFSLLSTGVDIPRLDTLVIAGDLKSTVLTQQSVGRILRTAAGKKTPRIIDIQDFGNPILKHQAKARERFYESQGWIYDEK